jgi:hypothetical protein
MLGLRSSRSLPAFVAAGDALFLFGSRFETATEIGGLGVPAGPVPEDPIARAHYCKIREIPAEFQRSGHSSPMRGQQR